MREIQVVMSDDVTYAETRERVSADGTHRLALDNEEAELDLTEQHYKELREMLRRWLDAGHPPSSETGRAGTPDAGGLRKGYKFAPGIIDRNRALRAWVDEQGLKNPRHQELPAYLSPAGTYKHPKWLVRMYDQHLAELAARPGGMRTGA